MVNRWHSTSMLGKYQPDLARRSPDNDDSGDDSDREFINDGNDVQDQYDGGSDLGKNSDDDYEEPAQDEEEEGEEGDGSGGPSTRTRSRNTPRVHTRVTRASRRRAVIDDSDCSQARSATQSSVVVELGDDEEEEGMEEGEPASPLVSPRKRVVVIDTDSDDDDVDKFGDKKSPGATNGGETAAALSAQSTPRKRGRPSPAQSAPVPLAHTPSCSGCQSAPSVPAPASSAAFPRYAIIDCSRVDDWTALLAKIAPAVSMHGGILSLGGPEMLEKELNNE